MIIFVRQMVPIPEGVERDEAEPIDDEMDTPVRKGKGPAGTKVGTVNIDVKLKRWVHNGQEELNLIE